MATVNGVTSLTDDIKEKAEEIKNEANVHFKSQLFFICLYFCTNFIVQVIKNYAHVCHLALDLVISSISDTHH